MAFLIGLVLRLARLAPLFGLLPLPLAWLALWGRSTTFSESCRIGLERTGAALAWGAGAVALFVGLIYGFSAWIQGPHSPSAPVMLFLLTSVVVVVVTIAYAGQAVSLVVVGTLLRRAAALDDRPYVSALIGFVVIYAVGMMPFVGRTITLVMSALGIGALLVHLKSWRKPVAAAVLLLALVAPAKAGPGTPFYELTDKRIAKELKKLHKKHPNLPDRVAAVSERFLGTPYRLGPLGEGPTGEYDRLPLYDFRHVDCTTYVEEVMALSLEPDLDKALDTLRKIRYKDGQISYETRNHFTELDWVPHNRWAGYLKDITLDVAPDKARTATKKVSKRDWYVHKSTADILGFGDEEAEKERRLGHLRELGAKYQDEMAALPYVPMQSLPQLIERIPSGTLANLVRTDQPDKETMVSHQVLLIRKGKTLFVRHAAYGQQVQDVPALEYFYRYFNSSWPLLGLNLQEITKPK